MLYREVAPDPRLRDLIKCFWALEHDYRKSFHNHERLWADVYPELIFTSGERYFRRAGSRRITLDANLIIGPFQKELELFCDGPIRLVAARFQPWGLRPFCKVPPARLRNCVVDCSQIWSTDLRPLAKILESLSDVETRIAKLENEILSLAAAMAKPKLLARRLAGEIVRSEGLMRISELSGKHGIHARQLERIFLEETGVTAKVFARIIRFNRAKKAIEDDPEIDLLTLAHDCGYADQSHFTRNFREMFSVTPSRYKALVKDKDRLFRQEFADVAFVQDNPPHAG